MSTPAVTAVTPFTGRRTNIQPPLAIAHTVTPGTQLLVVTFFNRTGGGGAALSLNVGASPLINVSGISGESPQFWYLLSPPIGAITVNITDPIYQTIVEGAVYNVTGNDAVIPFGPALRVYGFNSKTLTAAPASTPNSLAIDCVGISEATATPPPPMDPGSGQTELFDVLHPTDTHHRGAGSSKLSEGSATVMSYTMHDVPANVEFVYAAVAIHGTPIPVIQPGHVFAVRRTNYAVVRWDPLVHDWIGNPVVATSYVVQRASLIDESDLVTLATITTTDATGQIDTAFVDTNPPPTAVYRIISVAGAVQSEPSEPAIAMASPSLIDGKSELLDEKLLFWDNGNWDEKLWA